MAEDHRVKRWEKYLKIRRNMPKVLAFLKKGAILIMINKEYVERVGLQVHSFTVRGIGGGNREDAAFRAGTGEIMSKRENYEARFEKILLPIAGECGVEIYDVEYVKEGSDWYLRAYIDKEGGVTIEDCEKVSRAVSDIMDREDFIEDAYILEVSSPGLGRALKKDKHLARSIGEKVEIKTYRPIGKEKEFSGVLEAFDRESITIRQEEESRKFERGDIALIRLALEL